MSIVYDATPPENAPTGSITTLDFELTLAEPQSRIGVRVPRGALGRAEAMMEASPDAVEPRQWAAKHYWSEGTGAERRTVFEFDEPLPAGTVRLRVPYRA